MFVVVLLHLHLERLAVVVLGVVEPDHLVADLVDVHAIFLGHAHQLGDHEHRKRRGELLDEVALALLDHAVHDLAAHLRDARPQDRRPCAE
jgi:hypothetical protein